MSIREYRDGLREGWVANANIAPTRTVVYTRASDDFSTTLDCFVGGGVFNKEEKDKLEDYQSFKALNLTQTPTVNDTVLYDGETFKVKRWTKLGTLYNVYGRISRHNGKPVK